MKTLSRILLAVAAVLMLLTAVSCHKYDDDINELRSRLSQVEAQLTPGRSADRDH